MQIIPLANIPAQTLNTVLDGQDCTISVYWRQIRLYLDLAVDDTVICTGRICANRANILQAPTPLFDGTLHFWDAEADNAPDPNRLNTRYFLLYVPAGEELPDELRY